MAKLFIKSKKSNLFDFVEVGVTFFVVIVVCFVCFLLINGFNTALSSSDVTDDDYSPFIEGARDKLTSASDWSMLAFLVIALIFSVISARLIPTENLYIGIVLFMSFAFFIISFVISNVFGAFMDNADFSSFVLLNMPITHFLLKYFPFVTLIYVGVVMISFFGKESTGGGGM
jgi:hypothetical protein